MKQYKLVCVSKEDLDAIYLSQDIEMATVTHWGADDSNSCLLSLRRILLSKNYRILSIQGCEPNEPNLIQELISLQLKRLNQGLNPESPGFFEVFFDLEPDKSEVFKGGSIVYTVPGICPDEIFMFLLNVKNEK